MQTNTAGIKTKLKRKDALGQGTERVTKQGEEGYASLIHWLWVLTTPYRERPCHCLYSPLGGQEYHRHKFSNLSFSSDWRGEARLR